MEKKYGSSFYKPNQGDIIHYDFGLEPDPKLERAGREMAFPHYAIVVSPLIFNTTTGLAYVCPITSKVKGFVYEVRLPSGMQAQGVVLTDQLRSIDFKARSVSLVEKAPLEVLQEVIGKLRTIIDIL